MTTVCVVGSGGREHALATCLARTAEVVVAPGNGGTAGMSAEGHTISRTDLPPEAVEADLYVIGPEAPLVDGLADRLRGAGRLVVGPGADGARLEGSKAYMKEIAQLAGVPTARWASFTDAGAAIRHLQSMTAPYVIKTDGLAAGKGVLVTNDISEASEDIRAKLAGKSFGTAGQRVILEEGLSGPELSLLVLCDGRRAVPLPAAQDFKRLKTGDLGPNTGGMGAYSPVPFATDQVVDQVMDEMIEPTLTTLAASGISYRGVLYAGLMLTDGGPRLVEYNVRLGDPEAQAVLPRLDCDLAEVLIGVASGKIGAEPKVSAEAAVCVVSATPGYPSEPRTGERIGGVDAAATVEGVTVFHSGTAPGADGSLMSSGGRVLGVTGVGRDLAEARARAYSAVEMIELPGMSYRSDIALAASTSSSAAAAASAASAAAAGEPVR